MKFPFWAVVAAAIMFGCCATGFADSTPLSGSNKSLRPEPPSPVPHRITEANYKFTFKLFSELAKRNKGKTFFFSAPCASLALSMAYNGAAGETQKSMAEALQFGDRGLEYINNGNSDMLAYLRNNLAISLGVDLSLANSLWGSKDIEFNPDFLHRNEDFYNAQQIAAPDDSQPAAGISNWIHKEDKLGWIDSVMSETRPDDAPGLYLESAISFKGKWDMPFDKAATKRQDFTLPDNSKISVLMMSSKGKQLYKQGKDYQAILIPYSEGRIDMYIVLPSREMGIDAFVEKLDEKCWSSLVQGIDFYDGALVMPSFNLDCELDLGNALSAIGMTTAFDSSLADFSAMCPQKTWIGKVIQNPSIIVNEEGTGPSEWWIEGNSHHESKGKFEMTVDRPFFFMVKDTATNLILFMGVIVDPGTRVLMD